eukprot:52791-Eustigmatos_ZCMA.PRE.1
MSGENETPSEAERRCKVNNNARRAPVVRVTAQHSRCGPCCEKMSKPPLCACPVSAALASSAGARLRCV